MRLSIWPWSAISEARVVARTYRGALHQMERLAIEQRNDIEQLRRDLSFVTTERDTAWAKLARRSEAIGRGNRTRAQRRRGGLLPPPINDIAGHLADLRTETTG